MLVSNAALLKTSAAASPLSWCMSTSALTRWRPPPRVVLAHEHAHADWLPSTAQVDLAFTPEQWRRTVLVRTDTGRWIARRHLEACDFSSLATALKAGDITIQGSDAYADYREQLLPWQECETQVADYCRELGLPSTASDFLAGLRLGDRDRRAGRRWLPRQW